jgi:hypothetical protein
MLGVQQDPIAGRYEHDISPWSWMEERCQFLCSSTQLLGGMSTTRNVYWGLCASVKPEYGKMMMVRLLNKKMGGGLLGPVCKRETRIWQDDAGAY